jgi:transposase
MDNPGCLKSAAIREAIAARQAGILHLPPRPPDLNPIEQAFARLKALLRKAAVRSVEALWNTIGELFDHFAPAGCANYLANAGYGRSG